MKPIIKDLSEIISFIDTSKKIINEKSNVSIFRFKSISNAENGDISFCYNIDDKTVAMINDSSASVIICPSDIPINRIHSESTLILVNNPRLWFMRCINKFITKTYSSTIDKNSIIKSSHIGDNTSIGPFCFIEDNVEIGDNCVIYSGAQIYDGTKIGNNVKIFPSAIIGSAIFGPQRNESKILETCTHLAGVSIGNNVEIGSNTSVLPGFLQDTIIGDGTKISSQVYIGSGMKIGKNCMITGNTYFGGSCVLEDNVYVAPGANIRNGIKILKNSFVGMGSVVVKDIPENTTVFGVPAKPVDHNSDTNAINNIK